MNTTEIATKYGIGPNADDGELEYAVEWESDNSIGAPPINHNRKGLTAEQARLQAQLNNEGY
jgi:hypothetical protein